jgi:hypothetical protein
MAKKIELQIVETGTKAIATLLEEDAPKTCAALWQALEQSIETRTLHGTMLGRTIEVGLPEAHQRFDPTRIPMENATIYPVPGDILWRYFPPKAIRGLESPLWDILIVYGPEAPMRSPVGPMPCNAWAEITENRDAFFEDCAKMWFGGGRTIRIRRA